jgi:hypothetical protein
MFLAELGIAKRQGHGLVSEDLLDFLEAGASDDHMACEGVPEIVKAEIDNFCACQAASGTRTSGTGLTEGRLYDTVFYVRSQV